MVAAPPHQQLSLQTQKTGNHRRDYCLSKSKQARKHPDIFQVRSPSTRSTNGTVHNISDNLLTLVPPCRSYKLVQRHLLGELAEIKITGIPSTLHSSSNIVSSPSSSSAASAASVSKSPSSSASTPSPKVSAACAAADARWSQLDSMPELSAAAKIRREQLLDQLEKKRSTSKPHRL